MNKWDIDILMWLAEEQRLITDLISAPLDKLNDWITAHGGKVTHHHAAMCMYYRFQERINPQSLRAVPPSTTIINKSAVAAPIFGYGKITRDGKFTTT